MSNPKIEVEIGANISGLQTGAAQADKIIDSVGNSAAQAAPKIQRLSRATAGYNGVGIEFSRIIQDAPFGIIGVGNNITQLAQSFTNARNSGQSFTQIIGGVLSGGNALVLGISLLTTAFTILSQKGFFKAKESAEDAQKALDNYRKSLDDLRKSSLEGEITAQKEIQNFNLLRAQAENANVPLVKRIEAVRDLKKDYPDYLSNLTQEQILTGNVAGAYDRLTNSLLESAKARAASNIIIKNTEEILILQEQQLDNEQAIVNARDKVARLEASANNSAVNALRINGQITAQNTDLVRAKEELNDLLQPQIERATRVNELTTSNLRLNNEINTSLENGGTFTEAIIDKTEKLKRVYEDIANLPTTNPLERFDQMTQGFEAPIGATSGAAETKGITIPVFVDEFKRQLSEVDEIFESFGGSFINTFLIFAENVNSIIRNNLGEAFADLGYSLGEALAQGTGVIDALGGALLRSMARFIGDFGQQLIAVGVAGLAFSTLLEVIKQGGPAAIPASIAAIGAGIALTVLSGALRSSVGKGLGGGAGSSGVGTGSSFTGSGGSTGLNADRGINLTGEFRVNGNDLLYVIDRSKESQV